MPGYKIYLQMASMRTSFGIFAGNQNELLKRLSQHTCQGSLRMYGLGHRKALEAEFQELIRLLHNYVASVLSLRDHTLRIAKRLLGPEYKTYQAKAVAQFKDDEVPKFLQDLRNYLLHYSHAPMSRVTKWADSTTPPIVSIRLPKKELLSWNGWDPLSRNFIKGQAEDIVLETIVVNYSKRVNEFYAWLRAFKHTTCSRISGFWRCAFGTGRRLEEKRHRPPRLPRPHHLITPMARQHRVKRKGFVRFALRHGGSLSGL